MPGYPAGADPSPGQSPSATGRGNSWTTAPAGGPAAPVGTVPGAAEPPPVLAVAVPPAAVVAVVVVPGAALVVPLDVGAGAAAPGAGRVPGGGRRWPARPGTPPSWSPSGRTSAVRAAAGSAGAEAGCAVPATTAGSPVCGGTRGACTDAPVSTAQVQATSAGPSSLLDVLRST